jgi:hypothetical protein
MNFGHGILVSSQSYFCGWRKSPLSGPPYYLRRRIGPRGAFDVYALEVRGQKTTSNAAPQYSLNIRLISDKSFVRVSASMSKMRDFCGLSVSAGM